LLSLLFLRIAPLPPHWVANAVAPHLGIGPGLFWFSCFVGIAPISVIHVTIGSGLDKMASADDFHLLSLRNILGLLAVVVAVLIPVGLKRIFRKDIGDLAEAEAVLEEAGSDSLAVDVPPIHHPEDSDPARPRRYQAVDSGVVLAGPSAGDPNLDTDRFGGKLAKGKGRALEIIADIQEEDEEYDVYDTTGHVDRVHVHSHATHEKMMARAYSPLKGYGSIEPIPREDTIQAGGMLWPFGR